MYTKKVIQEILVKVSRRKLTLKQAFSKLRNLAYETLPFAKIDHHRTLRKTLPEVIYAEGKSKDQLIQIARKLEKHKSSLLITRLKPDSFKDLKKEIPALSYSAAGKVAYLPPSSPPPASGGRKKVRGKVVAIITAGTSDIPIAEEAKVTLEVLGRQCDMYYDLGVAGIHRLMDQVQKIEKASIVICIAGMEGALPSVLAGLISKPIIAVPSSVGYGAGFKGLAPLLSMLNSCAQGVAVVNIDSGFNAACFAHLVLNR